MPRYPGPDLTVRGPSLTRHSSATINDKRRFFVICAASVAAILVAVSFPRFVSFATPPALGKALRSDIGPSRMQSVLRRFGLASGPSGTQKQRSSSRAAASLEMATGGPRKDGAEVNDTPELWRKELAALPELDALNGALPSVFLAHGS